MLRLLSRSNPRDVRIPLNTNQLCLTLGAFTHGTAVRAVFIHISRPQHAHGHTHTLQRGKPKGFCLSFIIWNPETQMLRTRTTDTPGKTLHHRPRKLVYLLLASWVSSALIPSYGSLWGSATRNPRGGTEIEAGAICSRITGKRSNSLEF